MRRLSILSRCKKAFTLVELIAVMAIMAIAAAIVMPNISGLISRTEESKYKNYCVEATSYVRSYTNLLTLGEYKYPYEKNGKTEYYDITTPSGLTGALNEYNFDPAYQYYVLAFDANSAKTNPSDSLDELFDNTTLDKKDVMITVITTSSSGGRVSKYTLQGFWFYSYERSVIVYHYYAPGKICGTGFRKLTSNGK